MQTSANTERVMLAFGLDGLYRTALRPAAQNGPARIRAMGHVAEDLTHILADSPSGKLAYYEIRATVFDWLEKQGSTKRFGGRANKKGAAMYWYRQALKYGDIEAAHKYATRYYEMGGHRRADIPYPTKPTHPLASIPLKDRHAFRQSLTPAKEKTLKAALSWYKDLMDK